MVTAEQALSPDTQPVIARFIEIHDEQARTARDELARLRSLIDDAAERLLSSFNVIGEISARGMAQGASQDMEDAVGNAVSALQFQDMANQLVGHAARRIEVLERITATLGRLPAVSADELTQAVEGTVCDRADGPVAQACMTGGSVDLF